MVIQRHRAKPIPLKMHVSLGSPLGRAPAVAGERVVVATICPLRRLRRHRLAAARSRSGSDTTPWCHSFPSRRFATQRERLLAIPIITQIGRENKFSAEIYIPANSSFTTTAKFCRVFSVYLHRKPLRRGSIIRGTASSPRIQAHRSRRFPACRTACRRREPE